MMKGIEKLSPGLNPHLLLISKNLWTDKSAGFPLARRQIGMQVRRVRPLPGRAATARQLSNCYYLYRFISFVQPKVEKIPPIDHVGSC
jgi:hypothetical protein